MARAATTTDVFSAVAEPRRRQILDLLGGDELSVGELIAATGLAQPQVSKHLRVLREVRAVLVREDGRQRLYRCNGPALKPIGEWIEGFQELWTERFTELDAVLEQISEQEEHDDDGS
ncbi:MAG: ArsR/SmtB family transcription factor [Solirubrobacteraceae bacterium]